MSNLRKIFQIGFYILWLCSATSYIESFDALGFIWPRLLISCPTLKIHSDVTNYEVYALPRTVTLTWKQASFLRKILRQSFWCVLVTKTQSGDSSWQKLAQHTSLW